MSSRRRPADRARHGPVLGRQRGLPPLGYEPYGLRLLRLCQFLCRGLTSGGSALKPPTGMSRTSSVRRSLATG